MENVAPQEILIGNEVKNFQSLIISN